MGRIVKAGKMEQARGVVPLAENRESAVAEAAALIIEARAAADAEYAAAKDAAVILARKMAERIVGRAVELSPAVMGEIVAQALASVRARPGAVVLRVHPEDLPAVDQSRTVWLGKLATTADVRLVADPKVGRHGCVLDLPGGRMDARLGSQLDALEKALRERTRAAVPASK